MNPYLDIILRSASVYFFMTIAFHLFGKKELSQLNTTDVILILLISNAVQKAMVGRIPLYYEELQLHRFYLLLISL